MPPTAPKVRKGRKFNQVLEGARAVFMADGFEGASVDEIARVAAVSKATLYRYFPDKRLLFMEVANAECVRLGQEALDNIDMDADPRDVLAKNAQHFLRFITSTFGVQIFRICVAETERFPEIGQAFYNSGPAEMRREMADYFREAEARGGLKIDDYELAADQFGELCKVDIWPRLIFGVSKTVTEEEINRVVDGAVDMFMARYGT
ncbi:TetR/AcrR family transcriptional regulator [Sulfitobacter sp. M57]|uniref:TetR/AcrR family transcriptional regulator n=1 Tax=unclassified Sulfitobacter TaxID=196795 RepID=UPI0023E251E3|nr:MULTISPECIES: TetR/AcrR family transcriptional regulator [unclassified Sulfitobacter]MDF3415293.1 TetR/AcrR family transcriptional regulator [Sulfitobacter sp. KE5]MDF3422774.1 TetR/AcrR family transcriptional regulator [Sulfitobacter sp. KE43]MDF3433839.1 TetR/AcrR family transcriptional regulator [Sulfitobacter sp. KE42]MDF3459479.1 TetR/AcrR family transcriptional regulator [Sulfitobacter sp. S74]MDF3463378.1 TetR/AcrR family transcriptional regulator [Sulfitobacter sp. Ks18]